MKHLATIIICGLTCTASQAQTMTLAECIDRGMANNLQLTNAQTAIRKGRLGVTQNRSRLLPVIQGVAQMTDYLKSPVNVTTGVLLGKDFPDDPTWQTIKSMKYQTNAGILVSVPIYNQTIFANIDVAKTVEQLQSLSYEKAKEELTVQIGKVYYTAQASKEMLRLTDENICRMNELCEITEALYGQGVVMEVDLNRVRISRQMLQAERSVQHTLHEQQLNMLRYLMDMSVDSQLDVTPMDTIFSPIATSGTSTTLPEMRLAEEQRTLISKQIRSAKAEYLPTLSFTGYAGGLGYNEKFSQFTDNWFGNCYVGVSLRIPIFEANQRHLKIRQYKYDAEQAVNSQQLLKQQIDRSYADATLQMNRNMEIVRTQTECRRQAEQVYLVAEEQYKEGVASMTSLLQDDMQLRSAQAACIQAVSQCRLAQLDLLRLAGRLDELTRR